MVTYGIEPVRRQAKIVGWAIYRYSPDAPDELIGYRATRQQAQDEVARLRRGALTVAAN